MIVKSFAQAAMLSVGIVFAGLIFGASELLFSPLGFTAILLALFLEIFGNRW